MTKNRLNRELKLLQSPSLDQAPNVIIGPAPQYPINNISQTPNFDIGDIGNVLGTAGDLINTGITNAQTSDVSGVLNNMRPTLFNATDGDTLLDSWGNYKSITNPLSYEDIRGGSTGNRLGNTIGAAGKGAAAGSMFGPIGTIIGGAIGLGSGIAGWISGDNKAKKKQRELERRASRANTLSISSLHNNAANINNLNNIYTNASYYSLGGPLHTHGTVFQNSLNHINEGGTHQENPYGGVLLSISPDGVPNLAEEGEVKYNDYIFSNRLSPSKDMLSNYLLPSRFEGKSFADIVKSVSKESEEKPNDPIVERGLMSNLTRLQQAQEQMRYEEALAEGLEEVDNMEANIFKSGGPINPYAYNPITQFNHWDGNIGNYNQGYLDWVTNTFSQADLDNAYTTFPDSFERYAATNPEYKPTLAEARKLATDKKYSDFHRMMGGLYDNYLTDQNITRTNEGITPRPAFSESQLQTNVGDMSLKVPSLKEMAQNGPIIRNTNDSSNDKYKSYSYLRYAPAIGSALGVGLDLAGITNKPDYSHLDALANSINNVRDIDYMPIGNYLQYRPLDRNYYQNQLDSQAGATRRALLNTSGGNRAGAMAGLLASDLNAQTASGNLARQAEEYNLAQRERVEAFNRGTNQMNSQMDLQAQMASNQNDRWKFSAMAQMAQLRDGIEARANAGRSANLSNFFNSLGNIGREEFARNMIISNPRNYYWIDRLGDVHYKNEFYDLDSQQRSKIEDNVQKDLESRKKSTDKEQGE